VENVKDNFLWKGIGISMTRYGICVKEILKRTAIVEAENIEMAIQKVEEAVEREEIILDVDDYDERIIEPSEYWKDGKVPDDEDVSYYFELEKIDNATEKTD
jgi:hypothetical protein